MYKYSIEAKACALTAAARATVECVERNERTTVETREQDSMVE